MKRQLFSLAAIVLFAAVAFAQQPVQCTLASNCPVNANESGTWNVRIQDTSGNGLTTNSTTYTSKFALDINLLGTLGTAFSTAGKVDTKAADGDVYVRSNAASTFPVNANESGTWTVNIKGNAGGALDAAGQNASSPANELLIGGQFNTSPTTITSGNMSPLQLDSSGKLLVNCTGCSASSNVTLVPGTSGGLTYYHLIAAATNNATSLKGSAGQLYGAAIYDNAAYPVYLKFFNKATAPAPGTDTVIYEVPVQAGTEREVHTDEGIVFSTGIGFAVTKGIADSDNTSVAANDASIDLLYK